MNKHQKQIVIMFLLPLFIFAALKFVWPDYKISEQENRSLQLRPAFTWESLFDGSFSSSVEKWYADQFPFRNNFIEINTGIRKLMSLSFSEDHVTIIQGPANDLGIGEALPTLDDESSTQSQTDSEFSEQPIIADEIPTEALPTEAETLSSLTEADKPEETSITETTVEETETQEPSPGVDGPVDNYSAVIVVNNVAMEIYGFSESKSDRYVDLLNKLAAKVPSAQIYSLIAPTSIEFYSPEKYHTLSSSQQSAISYIYSRLDAGIRTVDVYSKLAANWQDYLYFRSDHHWTSLGAYYGYSAFAEASGYKPVPLDELDQGIIPGDFLGSLYRYTQSSELAANPDTVYYFEPRVSVTGTAYNDVSMKEGRSIQLIKKSTGSSSQYLAFIEGDHPLAHFKTSIDNGQSIIVLKESYGNAFVPYLTSHYENIYVADPRRIVMDLPAFINQHQINDVAIVNYTFAVSNQKWVDGFSQLIG